MKIDIPLEVQKATLEILKNFGENASITYGCLLAKQVMGLDERKCKALIKSFIKDVKKTLPDKDD
tara:strand:- start:112 stop:306 length:195 start_codon:yes stop_codon:yes gene_type:complete